MSVLATWKMKCPACGRDDQLDVRATVSVRLTSDGSDADESLDGGHEWDSKSECSCAACGWTGTVADAEAAGADTKPQT